ncbi:MAG: hypothetical protein K2H16_04635 [Prevotella sp.]|nr:hypothetical protein [Prevotella sp.]
MNRLIFNNGGQPVYLDDLRTLQEAAQTQMAILLEGLSGDESVFLFTKASCELVSFDNETLKPTLKIARNIVVKDGILYELPETTVTADSMESTIYIGFKTIEADVRTFEDGQEHACTQRHEAYWSTVKSSPSMVDALNLKTLWALVAPLINNNIATPNYRNINVQWHNGYTGKVDYKDIGDAYRVRINAASNNFEWEKYGTGDDNTAIFSFNDDSFPYSNRTFWADTVLGVGGDTSARESKGSIYNHEGTVHLDPNNIISYPAVCPVRAIFEIPK